MGSETLEETGLNKYQSQVLYNLIKIKEATASELVKATGISRVRVYDILNELYGMGLIRKVDDRPLRYIAYSPEETFERILDWKRERFEEERKRIVKNKKRIEEELKGAFGEDEKRPKNLMELVSLGKVSENETSKMISEATKDVRIISEAFEWIDSVEESLKKTRGKVRVILKAGGGKEVKKLQKRAVEKLEGIGAEVRYYKELPLRGCVVDEKKAILNLRDKGSSTLLRDCIFTTHPSFVSALEIYFENVWEASEEE